MIFGTRTGFPDPLPLAGLNGTNGFRITNSSYYVPGWWASSVAAVDINGDGFADILIRNTNGDVFVVYGNQGPWAASTTIGLGYGQLLDGVQGFMLGNIGGSGVDTVTIAAADINGDAYADIIFGEGGAATGTGSAFVIYGKSTSTVSGSTSTFLPNTTVSTTSGSKAITPASYTSLMVGDYLNSANIPKNTYIHDCNGGITTTGTVCTGTINLSSNATATASGTATVSAVNE